VLREFRAPLALRRLGGHGRQSQTWGDSFELVVG
jgi:hypothetical protein